MAQIRLTTTPLLLIAALVCTPVHSAISMCDYWSCGPKGNCSDASFARWDYTPTERFDENPEAFKDGQYFIFLVANVSTQLSNNYSDPTVQLFQHLLTVKGYISGVEYGVWLGIIADYQNQQNQRLFTRLGKVLVTGLKNPWNPLRSPYSGFAWVDVNNMAGWGILTQIILFLHYIILKQKGPHFFLMV